VGVHLKIVNGLLGLASIFFASFLVYAFVHSEVYLASPFRIGLFGGLPAVGLAGSLLCYRLSSENRAIVAFSAVAAIVALYAGEYVLSRQQGEAGKLPPEFKQRNGADVVQELRGKGFDASRRLAPMSLLRATKNNSLASPFSHEGREFLPLAGISGQRVVHCRETGEWITYKADQHGFNNPASVWADTPADVIVLGGSFAHGACVEQGKSMAAVLRKRVPRTVNLGSDGAGPLIMLAILTEFGPVLRPATVLWINMEENELHDLEVERRSPLLKGYLEATTFQNLAERQTLVDELLRGYVERGIKRQKAGVKPQRGKSAAESELFTPSFIAFWKLTETRRRLGLVLRSGNWDFQMQEAVLARAKEVAAGWGGRIVFVNLPYFESYRAIFSGLHRSENSVERLIEMASRLDIETIDGRSAFDNHEDPYSLFNPYFHRHYNAKGHRLAGETIWQGLSKGARN